MWAVIWPAQIDRIAFDEVREGERALALARGEVSVWQSWSDSVHPPLVPAIAALASHVLPVDLALRLPALLSGVLTLCLVAAAGARAGARAIAGWAAVLLATSPIWWTYASAISLDVPLAAAAAVALRGVLAGRRGVVLVVVGVVLAMLTKRQGLTLVGVAVLSAVLASAIRHGSRRVVAVAAGASLVVAGLGFAQYAATGVFLFGITIRLRELLATSPGLLVVLPAVLVGLAVAYRRAPAAGRQLMLPLAGFTAPLVVAPLIGSHPAPRYFLPAVASSSLLAIAAVWFAFGSSRLRHALCALVVVASTALQWSDLGGYYARQRGHREAVRWLGERPPAPVWSPSARFLRLAAELEGVSIGELHEVDRTTCARLEEALRDTVDRGWVVVPLYRDVGWLADVDAHARVMGLEPRAVVCREVGEVFDAGAMPRTGVTVLGPADGRPVLAIYERVRSVDDAALDASVEAVDLVDLTVPLSADWDRAGLAVAGRATGVELTFGPDRDPVPPERRSEIARRFGWPEGGGEFFLPRLGAPNVRFRSVLATVDWHHHRWLEVRVRGDVDALASVRLSIGFRSGSGSALLSEMERQREGDGWCLRLDLSPWTREQRSRLDWLGLSSRLAPGDPPVRLELRGLRLSNGG